MSMHLVAIPTEKIRRCPIQLRPVRKDTLDYIRLRESVSKQGICVPPLVRPVGERYDVVDGNHRFECALDLRLPEIDCVVRELTDREVLALQVSLHVTAITTRPVEYATRLWKIVQVDQSLTVNELAHELSQTPQWVNKILRLVNLDPEAKYLVDTGQLPLASAVELAKLPISYQKELISLVGALTADDLSDTMRVAARHYREGLKDTRTANNWAGITEFRPRFRNLGEVRHELVEPTLAGSVINKCSAETKIECFLAGVKWVTRMDPDSLESRRVAVDRLFSKIGVLNEE